jgi:ERCC4-related helicase
LEKARLENEGTLGNKGAENTEIKKIIKQEEPTQEVQVFVTGLKRTRTANSAPMASAQVEVFLNEVTERLLTELDKSKSQPEMSKAKEIQRLEARLKEHPDMMVIPTDKTNSYKVINKEKYIEWVLDHLKTDAIEVSADKLVKIYEEGNELLSKLLGNTLSEK